MNQGGVRACCAICTLPTNRRCTRCLSIYYCNTDHQKQDWKRHKIECSQKAPKQCSKKDIQDLSINDDNSQKVKEGIINSVEDSGSREIPNHEGKSDTRRSKKSKKKSGKDGSDCGTSSDSKQTNKLPSEPVEHSASAVGSSELGAKESVISSVVYTDKNLTSGSAITYEGSSEQEILSGQTQQLNTDFAMASSSNVLRALNRADLRVPTLPGYAQHEHNHRKEYPEATLRGTTAPFSYTQNSYQMDPSDPCYEICQRVIRDMTQYGVCVLDNFLGKERGQLVLNEVLSMYQSGIFKKGQLVSNPTSTEAQTIRSDLITWIDGKEPHCAYIRQLISYVDSIVLKANKMANNGKMGDYVINGRTRAMVACYPGSGAHYVKHVDNPNKDGRCITAIYYLNTDWDVNRFGGLLRVFPEGTNKVADIAPIFDRMLFFWSDRRNPHEVQPAYATRYAITLWYFDAHERAEARRQFKERGQPQTPSTSK